MTVERVPYDEFGLFHENAEEFGIPYAGPPVVRREFVPVDADRGVVEQRVAEESGRLPAGGAVTGWAALRLHGANLLDGTSDGRTPLPVPLETVRRQVGVTLPAHRAPTPSARLMLDHLRREATKIAED